MFTPCLPKATDSTTASPFSEAQLDKLSTSIPTLEDVVHNRLSVTRLGLEELRRLLTEGKVDEAEMIRQKIDEDCALLQRRLMKRQ